MESTGRPPRYYLTLCGPVFLQAPDGSDLTPRGRRARAILAILAVARGSPIERRVVQDRLWSDRPETHGRDSLKKSLAEIRQALAPAHSTLLKENGSTLALDLTAIDIDLFASGNGPDPSRRRSFLEGIDIPDAEFEAWLREVRGAYAVPETSGRAGTLPVAQERVTLGLLPVAAWDRPTWIGDVALDWISLALSEAGMIRIEDYRVLGEAGDKKGRREADLLLTAHLSGSGDRTICFLQLSEISRGEVIWSVRHPFDRPAPDETEFSALSASVVDRIHACVSRNRSIFATERHIATRTALSAIDHIFRLGDRDFDAAEALLGRALEVDQRGIFHAWLTFLAAFRLESHDGRNRQDLMELAASNADLACRSEPHNPVVAALVAHVYAFVHRDLGRAFEAVAPFGSSRPISPIYHDCLSMLHFYAGEHSTARSYALDAVALGQSNPYRYSFMTSVMMIEMAQGQLQSAIRWGERALAAQGTAGNVFGPTLRYLCAAYAQSGDISGAARVYGRLKRQTPGFSPSLLTLEDYPVPSAAARQSLMTGFSKLIDLTGE